MSGNRYDRTYDLDGETVRLGVHCSGVAREPRVRWQIGEQNGEHGYINLDTSEPVVRLEEGETLLLDGQQISEIPVPRSIGETLHGEVEKLGTVVPESNRITADPTAFPSEIDGFDRIGWESARNVMWYCPDEHPSPRAYQIERGELVFRAQEWAKDGISNQELIDQYDLTVTF